MALVKTFDANDLKEEFRTYNRDYFSYSACEAIIELFEECDTNTELDIIGLCCDFNEDYWEDIKEQYSNITEIEGAENIDELLNALIITLGQLKRLTTIFYINAFNNLTV